MYVVLDFLSFSFSEREKERERGGNKVIKELRLVRLHEIFTVLYVICPNILRIQIS